MLQGSEYRGSLNTDVEALTNETEPEGQKEADHCEDQEENSIFQMAENRTTLKIIFWVFIWINNRLLIIIK